MILNDNIPMINLQFSFNNPEVIPVLVGHRSNETTEERVVRKSHASGRLMIEPTEKCSIVDTLDGIESVGYELVDAFHQERIDPKDPTGRRRYHTVRFQFARSETAQISDEFKAIRDQIRNEFQDICEVAQWRVRAFLNPFYRNGEEVQGKNAVSINFEARNPLFHPNGEPVLVWRKDERGNRLGNCPVPQRFNLVLSVVDNELKLLDL